VPRYIRLGRLGLRRLNGGVRIRYSALLLAQNTTVTRGIL
jgi:hypothetical protein